MNQALRISPMLATVARTPGTLQVNWIRHTDGSWCALDGINLNDPHFAGLAGVYVIWHGGPAPNVVRVGQGAIRDRLTAHRTDIEIRLPKLLFKYELFVTWADVPEPSWRDGIEAHLAAQLRPQIGERSPAVTPIIVNLPQ